MTLHQTQSYVQWFEEIGRNDLALAGGKGANLGVLVHAGLPVPPGFVVTTAAYRAFTDDAEIQELIERLDSLDTADADALAATAVEIRSLIQQRSFDEAVERAVIDALDSDAETGKTYAVRSSATAEDLPTASFAGQHDTHLGVPADNVVDRIRDCMASLFTDRAVAYRARNDIAHSTVEMAVVVQEMADADAAGVLFTADPDTNSRKIASVDATFGLGDTVVSGEVSADNARVNKETGEVLDYDVGEKATELHVAAESGTDATSTGAERRGRRVLSDSQLRTLVDFGTRIEALFGYPQDIEWALVDDEFVVLQSRPVTSLIGVPEPRPTDGRLHVYLSVGHGQAMTDPMPPLALDFWTAVYGDTINDMLGTDGAWAARTTGRIYIDITPVLRNRVGRGVIVRTVSSISEPAGEGTARLLDERRSEFRGNRSLSSVPRAIRATVGSAPTVAQWGVEIIPATVGPFLKGANGAKEFSEWFREWGRELEATVLDTDDPRELVENTFAGFPGDALVEMKSKAMGVVVGPLAGGIIERVVPGADADLVASAGRGVESDIGTRMTLALGDLADIARETPAVEQAILDEQSYEAIRDIDGSEAFGTEFEAFLEEFGHRAAGEFDPSRPRWRDDPSALLGIVRGNLIADEKGAHRERFQERKREAKAAVEELRSNARSGLLGPLRGRLVDRLLSTYRAYIHLRDEPKHEVAHLFAAWHDALQQAGEHLVSEGALNAADDVWYLHHEELLALLDDPSGDLPDIQGRRREHERQKRVDIPALITSEGEIPRAERPDVGENVLLGTGVSAGTIEGTARIVHDPSKADLTTGDILVCPSTDPAWTPLFATAGGLVAEVGGRFTHGALVAREYGLPAVVSVAGATEQIADGQRIRVDGTNGVVELLED
ncbi:PEP/pyruvate-binding domain-containing protein [Halorubrum sp. Atlit-26R]|uniref:PEP/pyruvate-binding domain-containing protein n=1 Tax=Halorubrum sp. Atlit-26R TaxID=2282128 RepID=UPI000EF27A8C|nr:PEP/pyruvate-binding domain-containing protein [Halorubrum sp. Atlit-26R]RLM62623.1 pyruvate phosphate dikinase [Halorubrum sp. Atlit-26R]